MKITLQQIGSALSKFQNAFKIAISVVIVFLVTKFLGATAIEQAWAILTVIVVMGVRVGATLYASFYRVVGTLAGGILAVLLLKILPVQYNWAIMLGLFIIGLVCGRIIEDKVTLRIIGVTAILIFILGTTQTDPWHLSIQRLGYILLSIIISFLVSILIFPKHASRVLTNKISKALPQDGELLAGLVTNYLQGTALPASSREDLLAIKQQLVDSRELLAEMKLELWRGERSKEASFLSNFIDSQAAIYHSLIAMSKVVERKNGKEVTVHLEKGFEGLTTVIKKTFYDLSVYVHNKNIVFEKYVLTNTIREIESELTLARSKNLFASYPNETVLGLYAFIFNLEMIANQLINIKRIIAKIPQRF